MGKHSRTKVIKDVRCPKDLDFLTPILNRWCDLNLRYIDAHGGEDLPWWYIERTYIGFLAAATWMGGGVALEEWNTEKLKPTKSRGRCDLYILPSSKPAKEQVGLVMEAKKIRVLLDKPERWDTQMSAALLHAASDARCLCPGLNEECVGILFVEFLLPNSAGSDVPSVIEEWVSWVKEWQKRGVPRSFRADAWAYVFDTSSRYANGAVPQRESHSLHLGGGLFLLRSAPRRKAVEKQ